ncbi:MAG: single-stranded DNA-binding protein [Clostridia bacterium]|jgi:single-strand DNA-binding protein|nr:single-stranded DNA-binding protein [Clostridia bacterium]MBQ2384886.1 single-stranded DNA-binding protein [Clostridia bacterium]MBQ5633452.1 single-stranded DNA-binding protein [Clostridia bacterium]MBR2346852.1 single-stranded DNA-binding protein [Clostridia bacterium]MBR2613942.1 single-stranded DNA-binding protein [Clostridia bacterium]
MSLNLNKVVLAGRMTADPELKQTPSGVSVLSFTIAVNRSYVSKNSDQGERQADFINVVAWRNTAEFISKYFRKGSAICVSGSIQTRSWQDQQGQRRYATEVVADEAMFVESRSESTSQSSYTPDAYTQAPSFSSNPGSAPNFEDHNTDDDLPF